MEEEPYEIIMDSTYSKSNDTTDFKIPYIFFAKSLHDLYLTDFYNESNWEYRPKDSCLQINGDYTYDIDLCFTVDEMRSLYRWD